MCTMHAIVSVASVARPSRTIHFAQPAKVEVCSFWGSQVTIQLFVLLEMVDDNCRCKTVHTVEGRKFTAKKWHNLGFNKGNKGQMQSIRNEGTFGQVHTKNHLPALISPIDFSLAGG